MKEEISENKKSNKPLMICGTLIFNLFIISLSFFLYVFATPEIVYNYNIMAKVNFIVSVLIIPSIFMGLCNKKYYFLLNIIPLTILITMFFKAYDNIYVSTGFLDIRLFSEWVEAFGFALIVCALQKGCYAIIAILKKEILFLKKKKFWLTIIISIVSILAIYFAVLFVEFKYEVQEFNQQLIVLENNAEIVFEFDQAFKENKQNVYIDIDDMRMYMAVDIKNAITSINQYKIERLTLEEFNAICQSPNVIKGLTDKDNLEIYQNKTDFFPHILVEVYSGENTVVYNLRINVYYFIFIVSYNNEYFIIKETDASFITDKLQSLINEDNVHAEQRSGNVLLLRACGNGKKYKNCCGK